MPRHERTGVEFPDATWTSYDRYDRYGAIARCLRASLGAGRHRVLDVGDAAGYLAVFAGDLELVGVDLEIQTERLDGAVALVADGSRLPFADRTFDAAVTSDVLEHVLPEVRGAFLAEMSRVSRDLVIVAAPFDTEGVAGVEELIRRYVPIATGQPQDQLEEHMDRGLPDLDEATEALSAHGPVAVAGNGNLWDWLELMLVKHQLMARPALQPFQDGIDLLWNLSMAGRAVTPPFYRHLVVARRDEDPVFGEAQAPPFERASSVITSLLAAAGPESTRQDVEPTLALLLSGMGELASATDLQRLQASVDAVDARLGAIELDLAGVREQGNRVSSVLDRLGSPLRRVRGIGQRSDGG